MQVVGEGEGNTFPGKELLYLFFCESQRGRIRDGVVPRRSPVPLLLQKERLYSEGSAAQMHPSERRKEVGAVVLGRHLAGTGVWRRLRFLWFVVEAAAVSLDVAC